MWLRWLAWGIRGRGGKGSRSLGEESEEEGRMGWWWWRLRAWTKQKAASQRRVQEEAERLLMLLCSSKGAGTTGVLGKEGCRRLSSLVRPSLGVEAGGGLASDGAEVTRMRLTVHDRILVLGELVNLERRGRDRNRRGVSFAIVLLRLRVVPLYVSFNRHLQDLVWRDITRTLAWRAALEVESFLISSRI